MAVGNQLFGALPPSSGLECGSIWSVDQSSIGIKGSTYTLPIKRLTQLSTKKKQQQISPDPLCIIPCKCSVIWDIPHLWCQVVSLYFTTVEMNFKYQ